MQLLTPIELVGVLAVISIEGWQAAVFSLIWSLFAIDKLYQCQCHDSLPFQWAATVFLIFLTWTFALTRWNKSRNLL